MTNTNKNQCPTCKGSGLEYEGGAFQYDFDITCEDCNGTGKVSESTEPETAQ